MPGCPSMYIAFARMLFAPSTSLAQYSLFCRHIGSYIGQDFGMVAVARPDHILTLGVNTPGARPEPFDMDDDDGPVYASYDPSRPLLANMVPRVEGGVMNKAFEFPARGVAVSVQACRHCRCSYAAVADGSVLSRYPMWIGMKQRGLEDNSAAVDASEWTPVEFEVALFRTDEDACSSASRRSRPMSVAVPVSHPRRCTPHTASSATRASPTSSRCATSRRCSPISCSKVNACAHRAQPPGTSTQVLGWAPPNQKLAV